MASRVIDRDLGYKRLLENLEDLALASASTIGQGPSVFVGVRAETSSAEEVKIAAVNEFGSADGHIPERSFLRSTVIKQQPKYLRLLTRAVDRSLDGGKASLRRDLELIGLVAVGDVQRTITRLKEPPNAPSTIAAKGGDNPLIDTGRLAQSIDHVVEPF